MNWSFAYLVSEWLIRLAMLVYVPQQRSTAATRTWLLLIFLFPLPGLALYALMGRIYVPRQRIEQQRRASSRIREAQKGLDPQLHIHPDLPPHLQPLVQLATTLGDFEPFGGNQVELLADYDGAIRRLVEDIDGAQRHVHLLFYIFEADATGHRVADALIRAAGRGVKCRVLMDAVGSKKGLARLGKELRQAGVELHAMLQVGLFRRNASRFDLRNHRKIAVIDGTIGHTGSQNLVDGDFVKGFPNEELMARVTGPIATQLQAVFVTDYFFESGQTLDREAHFPVLAPTGTAIAQLLPSGPGYQRENSQEHFVSLLYAARRRVVLTTPYFIPDEPFLQAMHSAARRGVEVVLMLSAHANQRLTQFAQRAFYDELLEAGVEIRLYLPGFLHAKHLTVDDDIAVIGSTNIDIRSFALNAEINLVLYDRDVVRRLREIEDRRLADSDRLTLEDWRKRPVTIRVLQNIARLADSLL
jgi:cardiolipin synthase